MALPVKFGVDKRRAHLSTLIQSGQLSREEALAVLQTPAIPTEEVPQLKEYVAKKLGIQPEEFDRLMGLPVKSHYDYKTDSKIRKRLFALNRSIRNQG